MGEIAAVFGLNWKLLLIQIINFGLLVFVLWFFLYRRVIAMLDARRATIEKGVHDAKEAAQRLLDVEAEKEGIITDARTAAEEVAATAKQQAQTQARDIVTDAHERADSTLKSAEAQASELKEKALREAQDDIARAATLAAAKILEEK